MLHTVEVWQSILVQVRQAPGSPQALVRATHLTHGRVAHAARFTSLSHQNVKDSKWVHLITLIIYSRSPPPKNLYHPWGATPSVPDKPHFPLASAALLSLLHHYCQHSALLLNANSNSLTIDQHPPNPAIFTPTSQAMHVEGKQREGGRQRAACQNRRWWEGASQTLSKD